MYAAAGGASLASRQKRKNQAALNVKNKALLQQGLKDKLAASRASGLAAAVPTKAQSRAFHQLPTSYLLRTPTQLQAARKLSGYTQTQSRLLLPIDETAVGPISAQDSQFHHYHLHQQQNQQLHHPTQQQQQLQQQVFEQALRRSESQYHQRHHHHHHHLHHNHAPPPSVLQHHSTTIAHTTHYLPSSSSNVGRVVHKSATLPTVGRSAGADHSTPIITPPSQHVAIPPPPSTHSPPTQPVTFERRCSFYRERSHGELPVSTSLTSAAAAATAEASALVETPAEDEPVVVAVTIAVDHRTASFCPYGSSCAGYVINEYHVAVGADGGIEQPASLQSFQQQQQNQSQSQFTNGSTKKLISDFDESLCDTECRMSTCDQAEVKLSSVPAKRVRVCLLNFDMCVRVCICHMDVPCTCAVIMCVRFR